MEEVKEIIEERPENVEIQTTFNSDTFKELNDKDENFQIENAEEVEKDENEN